MDVARADGGEIIALGHCGQKRLQQGQFPWGEEAGADGPAVQMYRQA